MRRNLDENAIAGSFEELPALLVVLVAISLFSVSVAHAAMSLDDSDDYISLQKDCAAFARMVASSPVLCVEGQTNLIDPEDVVNLTVEDFQDEFNSTLLGFGYRIVIQCLDSENGNITMEWEIRTSESANVSEIACFNTCVSAAYPDRIGAARLSVSIWRPAL